MSRLISWIPGLQRMSFSFLKNIQQSTQAHDLFLLCQVFSFAQRSACWMRQLFISQLQHLFCTYTPLVACSLVGSRSIYSEVILPRPRHIMLDTLFNKPLHQAHLLRWQKALCKCHLHNYFVYEQCLRWNIYYVKVKKRRRLVIFNKPTIIHPQKSLVHLKLHRGNADNILPPNSGPCLRMRAFWIDWLSFRRHTTFQFLRWQ